MNTHRSSAPRGRMRGRVAVLMALAIGGTALVAGGAPTSAAPVDNPDPELIARWEPCEPNAGVTVIVDFQSIGDHKIHVGCADGDQESGVSALRSAGFKMTGTEQYGEGVVCRIDDLPVPDLNNCRGMPGGKAYWSYWYASQPGAAWGYSGVGALHPDNKPKAGSVQGWSFSTAEGTTVMPRLVPADATGPSAVTRAPKPTSAQASTLALGWIDKVAANLEQNSPDQVPRITRAFLSAGLAHTVAGSPAKDYGHLIGLVRDGITGYVTGNKPETPQFEGVAAARSIEFLTALGDPQDDAAVAELVERAKGLILPEGDRYEGFFAASVSSSGRLGSGNVATDLQSQLVRALLAGAGSVPASTVHALLSRQGSGGWFAGNCNKPTADECDPGPGYLSNGSTASALRALGAVRDAGPGAITGGTVDPVQLDAAITAGADWLVSQQHGTGGFAGSYPQGSEVVASPSQNLDTTFTTSLAAMGLHAAGRDREARAASRWIAAHQLTEATGVGDNLVGAVVPDAPQFGGIATVGFLVDPTTVTFADGSSPFNGAVNQSIRYATWAVEAWSAVPFADAQIATPKAQDMTADTATVTARFTPGTESQEVWASYRIGDGDEVSTPTQQVPAGGSAVDLEFALKDLEPDTEYSFRVHAASEQGTSIVTEPGSFTTLPVKDDPGTPPDESTAPHARTTAGWLVNELSPAGQMPGAAGTDWGLTIDTQWALYAAGTGAKSSKEITTGLAAHAGLFMGPDLYGDKDARVGGSTAKLLVAAIVAGKDPEAFGTGKHLSKGQTYDLRQETLDLLDDDAPHKGRITNRGTGDDDTNVFAQSFAVIGLARSGGVPAEAVDFLTSQQCAAGYFRMFYPDGKSCDDGNGTPDGDGTALGLQALMTARDAGVGGLDDEIDQGLDWLLSAQESDGSFAGGSSTPGANTNSTGLIAQTLYAGADDAPKARADKLRAAYAKARDWVLSVHAHAKTAKGSKLDTGHEYGAIAYTKSTFAAAKKAGIGTGTDKRDQWRRSSAQAIFALAPVSFADLGKTDPVGDPTDPGRPGDDTDPGPGDSDKPATGKDAPPPGTGRGTLLTPDAADKSKESATSAGKLAQFLASHLIDGDNIESLIDDQRYVDYDATADVVLALRALGEQPEAIRKASAFLLHPDSIDAYAHGKPYEKKKATYVVPAAKLALIARYWAAGGHAPKSINTTIASLDKTLAARQDDDGTFTDTGTYADHTSTTTRHAWATLALVAAGDTTAADKAVSVLLDAQCEDGTFAENLVHTSCATGDEQATELAVWALNAQTPTTGSSGTMSPASAASTLGAANVAPSSWDGARIKAIESAGMVLLSRTAASGMPTTGASPLSAAQLAGARQFLGLDATNTANTLGEQLTSDGGLPRATGGHEGDFETSLHAAPGVAGRAWVGAPRAPVTATVRLPLAGHDAPPTAAAPAATSTDSTGLWVAVWILAALLALVLVAWTAPRLVRLTGRGGHH